jgi:hypothetical protein
MKKHSCRYVHQGLKQRMSSAIHRARPLLQRLTSPWSADHENRSNPKSSQRKVLRKREYLTAIEIKKSPHEAGLGDGQASTFQH